MVGVVFMDILKRILISIVAAFVFTAAGIGLIVGIPVIIDWFNSLDGRFQLGVIAFVTVGIAAYVNTYQIF